MAVTRYRETALTSLPCCVLSPVPFDDALETLYEPNVVFSQFLGSASMTFFLLSFPCFLFLSCLFLLFLSFLFLLFLFRVLFSLSSLFSPFFSLYIC